ncbi:histidine kinase [Microbacterium hibisci]|uniref:histidine kinase n=1 Tax=Microbacterium hibisci TaxID=2036000 RepID=UPI00194288F5|nr:histidine kinase [Microbacterium hibisci]
MRTNLSGRAAAVLVGLEGAGLAALTVRELVAIVTGDTGSLVSAIALLVLTLIGAVAVLAFAVAIWRGQSWGRSGGIVTQFLILAVAIGAATGAFAEPALACALAAPALVVLVLLVLAVRDAGRAARRGDDVDGGAPGAASR